MEPNYITYWKKYPKRCIYLESEHICHQNDWLNVDKQHLRKDYTMHGLHLNYQAKMTLMPLIAERVTGGHVSCRSSTSVIIYATVFYLA
jgi:hypothetical protein